MLYPWFRPLPQDQEQGGAQSLQRGEASRQKGTGRQQGHLPKRKPKHGFLKDEKAPFKDVCQVSKSSLDGLLEAPELLEMTQL